MEHDDIIQHLDDLREAFVTGHGIGTILNDHVVEPLMDHLAVGSGEAGETYTEIINEYGDPLDLVESLQDMIEGVVYDCD